MKGQYELRIITDETKAEMKRVVDDIQFGGFVQKFILDNRAGQPELNASRKRAVAHPIEQTGAQLRAMMPMPSRDKNKKRTLQCRISPSTPSTMPANPSLTFPPHATRNPRPHLLFFLI